MFMQAMPWGEVSSWLVWEQHTSYTAVVARTAHTHHTSQHAPHPLPHSGKCDRVTNNSTAMIRYR